MDRQHSEQRTSQRNGLDPKASMNWIDFRGACDAKEAGEAPAEDL